MSRERMEQLKLPISSSRTHSRSPSKTRSPSRENKRKKTPLQRDSNSRSSRKLPPPLPGTSYSWDAAQGQAFLDKVSLGTRSASSLPSATVDQTSRDSPYMALVQLFNQFQGMPVDTKKTLVTVNVLGSTGPLRMLVTSDATVRDVIKMALLKYAHEGRVPSLGISTKEFELYDSQYSSQALKHEERIADIGTRNFVLCPLNMQKKSCGEESKSPSKSWWSYVTGIKSLV